MRLHNSFRIRYSAGHLRVPPRAHAGIISARRLDIYTLLVQRARLCLERAMQTQAGKPVFFESWLRLGLMDTALLIISEDRLVHVG